MAKRKITPKRKNEKNVKGKRLKVIILLCIFFFIFFGIPLSFIQYQSYKTGKTWSQILASFTSENTKEFDFNKSIKEEKIDFLISKTIGDSFTEPPQISHLQAVDLDQDQLLDVMVCDALNNTISWIRQNSLNVFKEKNLAENIIAPSHIQAFDFDKDSDLDLIVSVMGMIFPSNDKIGSIIILENDGLQNFTKHTIIEKVARVSDVRAGDLDGDGDFDLAAAQFGYDDGETRWIENLGNWQFKSHILQTLSGPINCEIVDIDNDSDLDIITIVSQEWEETYLFINDGNGNFQSKLLYGVSNDDFGSSGIYLSDFDQDEDVDILYTNGDAFDYIPPKPRPWHGVNWLENKGNYQFEFHRIANLGGAYNARPLDVDKDGDLDIFVVSSFNIWDNPSAQSFIWLENDGFMNFTWYDITNNPTHILPLELGDFNNDGQIDFVTGCMHICPPYDRMSRIMLWINNWDEVVK